ncbi:MAG TPA: hypothetical protein VGD68_11235 [Streptosporangiaceae bacterium]
MIEPTLPEQTRAAAARLSLNLSIAPAARRPDDQAAQPDQSREDTDAGWGERPDPDEDELRFGERPPHWGSD